MELQDAISIEVASLEHRVAFTCGGQSVVSPLQQTAVAISVAISHKLITEGHGDCGPCDQNDNGSPCWTGVHCSNENSDPYVCEGDCPVPEP